MMTLITDGKETRLNSDQFINILKSSSSLTTSSIMQLKIVFLRLEQANKSVIKKVCIGSWAFKKGRSLIFV